MYVRGREREKRYPSAVHASGEKVAPRVQNHLQETQRVHLGAYYTEDEYVCRAWEMLERHCGVSVKTTILDSACGYGGFIRNEPNNVGCDIDPVAISRARREKPKALFRRANSLENVSRKRFGISKDSKLVIVGNPPFNDRTSLIRRETKRKHTKIRIDEDLRSRDLGISFLRSFDKLKADAVCVLHPLSYLIKPANFSALKNFSRHYSLIEARIINSNVFSDNSQSVSFPIIVALYKRSEAGMTHSDVTGYRFPINDTLSFRPGDFQYIDGLVSKYPRKRTPDDMDGVMFWTLRDINALRRNRTFLTEKSSNAVFIDRRQLDYYAYIDVFKRFMDRIPFYMGNSSVMIDEGLFREYRKYFVHDAARRHPCLRGHFGWPDGVRDEEAVRKAEEYFRRLLGEHFLNA